MKNYWKLYAGAIIYTLLTLIILFITVQKSFIMQKPRFFFQDTTIPERVYEEIIKNPNGDKVILTRVFHNKIGFAANNLFISLARSTDPVFFFSLTSKPYYGSSYYTFTSPIFFPIFIIATLALIKNWGKIKRKYNFLPFLLIFSLITSVLFLPYINFLKLLPLFITVQLIIFFGCYELISKIREFKQSNNKK